MVCLPCLALSSENSRATSSNFTPSRSLASASSFLECFSHCATLGCQPGALDCQASQQPELRIGSIDRVQKRMWRTKICRALMELAALSFPELLASPSSLPLALPFPAALPL